MTFTYDLTTDIGKVRLLCRDTATATAVFTDEEIQSFLDMESSVVKLAAAQAMENAASNQSIVIKITSALGFSVNGVAVAQDLRNAAAELRRQVEEDGSFDIAETTWEDLV